MTPVLDMSAHSPATEEFLIATQIVLDAAEALAAECGNPLDASRYLLAADRIAAALESPHPCRQQILQASPALTELSGRSRTLIEIIEAEPGDEIRTLRLAKLLFRAVIWRPETFPYPGP